MNTVVKSALFAAIILAGGIYVADIVYEKISNDQSGQMARVEPAAGLEMQETDMVDSGFEVENAEGDEDIFELDAQAEAQNENILEVIEQESELVGDEINAETQSMIDEMDSEVNEAIRTEPAAGDDADSQQEEVPVLE